MKKLLSFLLWLFGLDNVNGQNQSRAGAPALLADALADLADIEAHRDTLTPSQADHLRRARRILTKQAPSEADLADAAYELRYANAAPLLDLKVGGDPCRPFVLDPAWASPTTASLAQAADEERQLDGSLCPVRLAILADALEDAGCMNADLLAHLRGLGQHAGRCWAVALLLGAK
jgi:hypothetical protein